MSKEIYLGTRKGLFVVRRSGGAWGIDETAFLGAHVPMLLPDARDGTLYVVIEDGHFGTKLHRREAGVAGWEEMVTPSYPPVPEGAVEVRDPMRGTVVPWSLEKLWCLENGGADEPGRLWAGTIPGGLFTSLDSGKSWELVRSLWDRPERAAWGGGGYDFPGIHSICVDPRDSKHVLVAVSCGGIWRTRDAGASWELTGKGMGADYMPPALADDPNIQDPHRLAQCLSDPDGLWVQHHCAIFRSGNRAGSWDRVEAARPSGFGFAVAVHPKDPNTAWFVPAVKDEFRIPVDGRLVVSRTRDGGKTFEVLDDGLPQKHAYHLVYRHGLDVDETGELLAMGSTTGGVWISETGGDSWTELSNDLPPVYCVRIA